MPAGLGGEYEGGELTLGAADSGELPDLTAHLQVRGEDGTVVTQLPLKLTHRQSGQRGGDLFFTDSSGAVTATLRLDSTSRQANCNYQFSEPDSYNPPMLLPAVRFVSKIGEASSVAVLLNGQLCAVGRPTIDTNHFRDAIGFANLLEALVILQTRTGIYFEVSGHLTPEEVHALDTAVRLLEGEVLTGTWTSVNVVVRPEGLGMMHAIGLSVPQPMRVANDMSIVIQDVQIPIGRVVNEIESARVSDDTSLPSDISAPLEITFNPGDNNAVKTWLETD